VHTGFPSYPSGRVLAPYRNRRAQRERDRDVEVVRSVVYPTPNRGFARRLANHTAFAAGALATARLTGPADVVVAETPPLFTAAAGIPYAAGKRAALALNVSDLWPESAIALGALRDGPMASGAHALARLCYRNAALIVAPTRGIVDTLRARPESTGKVFQVPPAVDVGRFSAVAPAQPRPDAPLRVCYAGTLGLAQGLGVLIDAAALAGPATVELLIVGEGPEAPALARAISDRRLANVQLLGPRAPSEVPALYASVDAGLVPLRDRPIFEGALPTKLFEVMAAGRAAIVAARGEAAELVSGARAGLVVAPEDPVALAAAFSRLQSAPAQVAAMGERARTAARGYDRSRAVSLWSDLLREVVVRRSPTTAAGRRRSG